MFNFVSSDWFTITLEIVFLIFIAYDLKKYYETRKKEYIVNIVLTFGFFIWAIVPFYNSYMTWEDRDKTELISTCKKENNETMCNCLDDRIFKEYTYDEFKNLDKNSTDFKAFVKQTKEECLDDSWF
ncbi:hypothetical protein HUE87_09740 [Candidatus Sulfurimonas marisnigri]|uniref:Uncharacterized protein n=1 Tax=Candidatus Sulfurimonas marisnigri TaxID=2740405 RepID=A0A7S7LZ97_9BACT|nr:hypothetical protein [Candidatus Sulfurimonas marisnigri]QOY54157.1 hypothetical protein HUE87_09740 [Candidatus Sulfurimonas marisnigri]